ncbi:hypothetical protein HDV04_003511 [Boothiomyces sp. JEL0838]|nr:hypothetical protein HDV04_003511 [Boothiomyces sp. JEL0838]
METLPTEIWSLIAGYLRQKDLIQFCRASKKLFHSGIGILYKHPMIPPMATRNSWTKFVDLIEYRNGYCDYGQFITECDDVWLYVGDDEGMPKLERRDSKMDIDIPLYSIYHALEIIMKRNLSKLTIQFYSNSLESLPWARAFDNLVYLDLKILVTDSFLDMLFKTPNQLKYLYLNRAEISDAGLMLIADSCKAVRDLYINIIPLSDRSRYAILTDTSRSQLISNNGAEYLFKNLVKLEKVNIINVALSPASFKFLNRGITSLSITLNDQASMNFDSVILLLDELPNIQELKFVPGGTLSESVITEEFITTIPKVLKQIKRIDLQGFDYQKDNIYYGVKNNMWYLDQFNQSFRKQFPNVELIYNK